MQEGRKMLAAALEKKKRKQESVVKVEESEGEPPVKKASVVGEPVKITGYVGFLILGLFLHPRHSKSAMLVIIVVAFQHVSHL